MVHLAYFSFSQPQSGKEKELKAASFVRKNQKTNKRERQLPVVEVFLHSIFSIHDQRVKIVSENEKFISSCCVGDREEDVCLLQGFLKYFLKIFHPTGFNSHNLFFIILRKLQKNVDVL